MILGMVLYFSWAHNPRMQENFVVIHFIWQNEYKAFIKNRILYNFDKLYNHKQCQVYITKFSDNSHLSRGKHIISYWLYSYVITIKHMCHFRWIVVALRPYCYQYNSTKNGCYISSKCRSMYVTSVHIKPVKSHLYMFCLYALQNWGDMSIKWFTAEQLMALCWWTLKQTTRRTYWTSTKLWPLLYYDTFHSYDKLFKKTIQEARCSYCIKYFGKYQSYWGAPR